MRSIARVVIGQLLLVAATDVLNVTEMDAEKGSNGELETQMKLLVDTVDKLQRTVNRLENRIQALEETHEDTPVFFSAGSDKDQLMWAGQTMAFEKVFHNVGGHFRHNGFTAPVAGYYVFTLGVVTYAQGADITLHMDNAPLTGTLANTAAYSHGSVTAVARVSRGARVTARCSRPQSCQVRGGYRHMNVFSGYLLRRDE